MNDAHRFIRVRGAACSHSLLPNTPTMDNFRCNPLRFACWPRWKVPLSKKTNKGVEEFRVTEDTQQSDRISEISYEDTGAGAGSRTPAPHSAI